MKQAETQTAEGERLVKFLAGAGIASRRAAGELVKAGRVAVNGEVEFEPGRRLLPGDVVTFDGAVVAPVETLHYIMLNKPRGYVCTSADPHAEHRAIELIDLPVRLFSAGRLDKESEGMILFSNDGAFVEHLSHPRYGILKRYHVRVKRDFASGELEKIRSGVEDDGEILRVHSVRRIAPCEYEFILNEGRKREIRRITARCGAPTVRLKRVQIGALKLGSLPAGAWRELSPEERRAALTVLPDEPFPSERRPTRRER